MYPGIELRTMRYIVAVGSELHFSRAAEKVRVAQPSLSKQIRNVEDELGVELFKRTRKKVEITEPGRAFIENAQQALLFAERAAAMARSANAGEQGKLFLGVSPSLDVNLYFRIRGAFARHHPEVQFHFVTGMASDQAERIMRSDLHAGLIELPIRYRGLAVVNIHREPLVMAFPRHDQLTSAGAIHPHQLRQRSLVVISREAEPASEKILTSLHGWGYQPDKVFLVLTLAQAFDFVAAGEAIAVIRASAQRFESKRVVLREMVELPTLDTGLAYRRDVRSPLVRNLIRIVREVFAEERARMIADKTSARRHCG